MKKLSLLFLGILTLSAIFQSCSDTKTYAEMLEDEKRAIRKFLSKHDIKVISQSEFEKDTVTGENEYVLLSNGVYLHIDDRGDGDSIVDRNVVTLRMKEYNIMSEISSKFAEGDTISNIDHQGEVDSFIYNSTSSSILFDYEGWFPYVYYNYMYQSNLDIPQGIIKVIPYLRGNARIKLIVPSKMGHQYAMQYVYPYWYDIHTLGVWWSWD